MSKKTPYELSLKAEQTYFWCSCGKSSRPPFCDGTHKTLEGLKRSLPFQLSQDETVILCGCENTKNPPYCDCNHLLINNDSK